MNDLRSEFDIYTSAGEPPMELTFDGVMTAAKRKYQRRRSTAIASGVAAVAVAAIAVPTLIAAPNSSSVSPAASADCAVDTSRSERVACALQREVGPLLAAPLRLDPPLIQEEWPNMPFLVLRYNARVSNGSQAVGAVELSVYKNDANPCLSGEPCEEVTGPNGQQLYVFKPPAKQPEVTATSPAVRVWTRGYDVTVNAPKGDGNGQLLSVDAMVRITGTPELLP